MWKCQLSCVKKILQQQQQNRQNKPWQIDNQSRPKAEGNYGSNDKFTQSLGPSVSVEILWAWQNQKQEAHAVGGFSPRFLPSAGGAFILPLMPPVGTFRTRLLTRLRQLCKCVHFLCTAIKITWILYEVSCSLNFVVSFVAVLYFYFYKKRHVLYSYVSKTFWAICVWVTSKKLNLSIMQASETYTFKMYYGIQFLFEPNALCLTTFLNQSTVSVLNS